jgi:acetyl esterase/lipase
MKSLALLVLGLFLSLRIQAEELRRTEVIYGRKFGTALTLDVLQPPKTNGLAVVWVISGGFYSDHGAINPGYCKALLDRGYTVFAVVHGSQPRFTIPEIAEDIHRSIRWIRHHAADYGIRPDRIGITGASAGGHLSLTLGTQGRDGDPAAKDPVDRESSRVQAVACFFPPTDFANWSAPGDTQVGVGKVGRQFYGAFGSRSDVLETRVPYGREISPIHYVTREMAPTLVIHGEADGLVPIYQAEIFQKKCAEVGATYKLVRLPGKDHGWPGMEKDLAQFADWYDEQLRR